MELDRKLSGPRPSLTRDRVLAAAVELADADGLDGLSMRKLADHLGAGAMSLYNHVANKNDLLNGLIDSVVAEIGVLDVRQDQNHTFDWKRDLRAQAMAARAVVNRHPWAPELIASHQHMSEKMLVYMDAIVGSFVAGGFSPELTHHAMHLVGSRLLGFTQELFIDDGGKVDTDFLSQGRSLFPNIVSLMGQIEHDNDEEFEFGLDLILDGLERRRDASR